MLTMRKKMQYATEQNYNKQTGRQVNRHKYCYHTLIMKMVGALPDDKYPNISFL